MLKVLFSKHPGAHPPMEGSLEAYGGKPPAFVPVDVTNKTVASVARQLLVAAGTGGTYLVSLQHWFLRFGAASAGLQ